MKHLIGSLLLSSPRRAGPARHAPVPGGVAVIDLGPSNASPPSALWGDQPLAVVKEGGRWFALLGIPLDTLPGELEIRVTAGGGTLAKAVAIAVKNYPEQRLTIKDKRKVEPSAEDIARIEHEQKVTGGQETLHQQPARYGAGAALGRTARHASACAASSTASHAIRMPGWMWPPAPARRCAPRAMRWWPTPAITFSTATRSFSTMARA
jgi:hypothetical protein